LLVKVLVGAGRHNSTAVITLEKLFVFVIAESEIRIDIIEALADTDEFICRNVYDIMDIDKVALKHLGKKRDKNLLAQIAEFLGCHMVPVCAYAGLNPMPRNIAR
jgi:hypothetical protein